MALLHLLATCVRFFDLPGDPVRISPRSLAQRWT
jgi:hypothetical protein